MTTYVVALFPDMPFLLPRGLTSTKHLESCLGRENQFLLRIKIDSLTYSTSAPRSVSSRCREFSSNLPNGMARHGDGRWKTFRQWDEVGSVSTSESNAKGESDDLMLLIIETPKCGYVIQCGTEDVQALPGHQAETYALQRRNA